MTDVVENTEPVLVDVSTGEPVENTDDVKIVRREVTVVYTMTYKKDTPDEILNATDERVLDAEITKFQPFDFKATNHTSTVLEGEERATYLTLCEEENRKQKEYSDLVAKAEQGDETAMLTLLFGPEFVAAAALDFEDDEVTATS